MLRSMFTAVSSLNLHQSYLDVVANNLANANTTGYKSSRVMFHDQYSQLISPGAGPSTSLGGINPTQIGLGVKLGFISSDFTQGMLESTGRTLDLAIQGDGFFVYDQGAARRYSREGSLSLDSDGVLVNSATGLKVQGWMVQTDGSVNTNLPPAQIDIDTDKAVAAATSKVIFGGNLDSTKAIGDNVTTTMGVYDSLGVLHTAEVTFTRTSDTEWDWSVTKIDDVDVDPADANGSGTITFTEGQNPVITGEDSVTIPGSDGAEATVSMTFDLTSLTMLSMNDGVTVTSQDGLPAGNVTGLYITPNDGTVFLVFSNGYRQQIAQLALARFSNPTGLISAGDTMFKQGLNSGDPELGTANTGGRGTITSGYLEASNVDMAREFTNMILAQRGFQASSRVITTSDEIMQELVNLKR
jgi:flagellar hook protein FlgE